MEFRILGPLEVVAEAGPVPLPRGRGRALLALLILRAGEVVSTERLVDELWGQTPPPTAITALHGLVSTLRRRLEPGRGAGEAPSVLQTRAPGYVLAVDRGQVDAERFRQLTEQAADRPASERAALLRAALDLWRGPALAEFTYEPFAQAAITALSELRLTVLEERIEADLALGRHSELIGELEGLIVEHPFRERTRGQLMLALYRSGRQSEALDVYRDARRALVGELGLEPGPVLHDLEQAILRQDRMLDLPSVSPAAEAATAPADLNATAQPWLTRSRKTVTVVFVDVAGVTATAGQSDPEALQRLVGHGVEVATAVLTRHGGTVEGVLGDVAVAVFGVPVAHEDDAVRAMRAAVELRSALAGLTAELVGERGTRMSARIGVNTGEVVVADPGTYGATASGATVKVAARLQQSAAEGEVLIGDATRRLVEDAVVVEPVDSPTADGGASDVVAWRVVDLMPDAAARIRRRDTPMVGRMGELARLRAAFDRALREQRAALVTVVGDPGIGKSRLALELGNTLRRDALALTGHCPAYGDGITFWPLREIVTEASGRLTRDSLVELLARAEDPESTAEVVAGAVGLTDTTERPSELFPAVRRLFETLSAKQPLLVVLEDVHWAQPTFLDLVEYLAGSVRGAVLFLCLARPEFLGERRDWGREPDDTRPLVLRPLGADDSEKLVADRLAGRMLPPDTVARVIQTAQGNPLFLEQMLAALRGEQESREPLSIPPSVQALLVARLDRLGPAERDLLRCAAVVGVEFSVGALTALVPDEAHRFVARHLQALEDKELIRRARQPFLGQPAFAFRHVLIQLAAYSTITREARSELHERVAGWLDTHTRAHMPELDGVIGYHLEQACDQLRHLGVADDHSRALTVRAGERLASAGLRAYGRFDVAAAANLFARADTLLPLAHPEGPRIRRHLAEAYQVLGRHDEAARLLESMLEELNADEDPTLEHTVSLEQARIRLFTGPDPVRLDTIRHEAERALVAFAESGNEAGRAQACYILGLAHLCRGEVGEMEAVARRGLAHADRSGEPREEVQARVNLAVALVAGETPIPDCIRACEQLAPWRGMQHPMILSELAGLRAMQGDFREAHALIARARRLLVERIRGRRPLMFLAGSSAAVETLAGNLAAAEHELDTALQMARDMNEREWVSQFAAGLSRLLAMRGSQEAEKLSALSREAAPAENVTAQALSRAATARVLANQEHHAEAQRLAREAVRLAPSAMLTLSADLRMDLGEVLLADGQHHAARPVITQAIDLYERKGSLMGAQRARALARQRGLDLP